MPVSSGSFDYGDKSVDFAQDDGKSSGRFL